MTNWITSDDFIEVYTKLQQRGANYLFSKFNISATKRTQSTFGESSFQHANWWIIPAVRRRWNQLITGDPDTIYEDYFVAKYLKGKKNLSVLALGCGIGSHERNLARHKDTFAHIDAYDIAPNLIDRANQMAQEEGLDNITFHRANVNSMSFEPSQYDLVFFHSSLHHFRNLEKLIGETIPHTLKPEGLLLLNDYWGPDRLQWSEAQLEESRRLLMLIPKEKRQRFRSKRIKSSISGPGWLRMRLSDPSEAAESSQIQPLLRKHYSSLEETPIGGSLLIPIFKDIAHHFIKEPKKNQAFLKSLFQAEDTFMEKHGSLLFFGVYRPKKS